ncbi:MAG TPA: sulfatase [Lacipirellulaceae bacterium]|nr:sulfatase [Lacipirellulaceae bacterium]
MYIARYMDFVCKCLALVVIAFGSRATLAAEIPKRPNIVFIYADDWRWDCLGVVQREEGDKARFPWLETPRLDKFAGQSVRFNQSFVVNSLCSPGRACVLTGRYSHLNGIIDNKTPMSADTPTVGSRLRDAGYNTAYCGKFHMDSQRTRPGFDYVASFIGQGHYNDCPFILNGKLTPTQGWVDDVSTNYAIKFLEQQTTDKPFFLWLGFKSPHGPRGGKRIPARFRHLYADKESRPVPNCDVPAIFYRKTKPERGSSQERPGPHYQAHRAYMQHITAIDGCIGRVLDAIDRTGHADDTIVMISSDNGFYLGEHQLDDKRSAYDESLRVPLLVRLPGKNTLRGTTSEAMVLNVDYAPTILDFAGARPLPDTQGRSLRPLLSGESPAGWRKAFFYEYFKETPYTSPTILAVRTDTHKLITYPGHDEWTEVFDLVHDPYETKNLVSDGALLKSLRNVFDEESAAVQFHMPKLVSPPRKSSGSTKQKIRAVGTS